MYIPELNLHIEPKFYSKEKLDNDKSLVQDVTNIKDEKKIWNEEILQLTPQQKQQAQQLYSQYLDTIFPNSVVKDIVYHGTNTYIESFDKNKISSNTLNYGFYGKGFYFNETSDDLISWWKTLYKKEPTIVTAIINIKNPYKEDSKVIEEKTKLGNKKETEEFTDNLLQKNYDAILPQIPKEEGSKEFVVFEPEQIHILSSKQDIEGFKEFVKDTQVVDKNDIYSQLGNKTKSGNVVIKSWGELKDATKAITSQGIISTRIPNTNEHFGNPFSHDPAGKTRGLIKTETIKEAVEKYIDWVINSRDLRAEWIREQLKSGESKNKPVLYYKELGEPSHATALDYLINKYDWNTQEDINNEENPFECK